MPDNMYTVKRDIGDGKIKLERNQIRTIQDWNIDDIKFTEIETVDIIKAKEQLKE